MTTVAQQSECFLAALVNRRRNPVKPATIQAYQRWLGKWIVPHLGALELASVDNGIMKKFVDFLVESELAPATIRSIAGALKAVVGSEIDANGNKLHLRDWNEIYIDAPQVDPSAQNTPAATDLQVNTALRSASPQYQVFYAIQAASGCRIGEMMALRMGPDTGSGSFLDLDKSVLFVRSAMAAIERVEQSPKSAAGMREVDLHETIIDWLRVKITHSPFHRKAGELLFQNETGGFMHQTTLRENFERDGLPPSHSLRRFRTTHLVNMSVPAPLVDYWTGHKGKTMTDRYTMLESSLEARKNWCRRAGLGFQLPSAMDNTIVGGLYQKEPQEVL